MGKKALVIGISQYDELDDLDFSENDGRRVCEVLRKLDYEIPDERVLVGNIKFDTLRRGINKFFPDKSTNSDDTQLFYFSGHGIPEGNGYYYLAASDLDPAAPYNEGYSFYELTAMME